MTQGERSERRVDLTDLAHELTEIALALPWGWAVLVEHNGQVRIVPPAARDMAFTYPPSASPSRRR